MNAYIDANGNYYEGDSLPGATPVVPRPGPAYLFSGGAWMQDMKQVREQQIAAIEQTRDAACTAPVQALGRTWQADQRSVSLLNSAITLAQAGLPLPPVWRDADNQDMPVVSVADLLAIAGAIAAQVQTAYAESWVAKAGL